MKEELGYWKGTKVFAILKNEYEKSNQNIYVIWDDGRQVVFDGMVIGKLDNSGYITEVKHKVYKVEKAKPSQKKEKKEVKPQKELSAAEILLADALAANEEWYKEFSKIVDEFFNPSTSGQNGVVLGERKPLWGESSK